MEVAQIVDVTFMRLINVFGLDFYYDIYDTVLLSAPPDPALELGKKFVQNGADKDNMTPEMLEKYQNNENWRFVNKGVSVGAHSRNYGRNMEADYAMFSNLSIIVSMKLPYGESALSMISHSWPLIL